MSLDGYIAGPNDKPGNPGGDNFMRLHEWYGFASDAAPTAETVNASGIGSQFLDEIKGTGAVLSGRTLRIRWQKYVCPVPCSNLVGGDTVRFGIL